MIRSHAALMKLCAFIGMFLGFAAQLEFTNRVKGANWWLLQPLPVTFAPILVGLLGGMYLGLRFALIFPVRCPFCPGWSRGRYSGEPRRWGYWCNRCGRNGLESPELQPIRNPPMPEAKSDW